MAEHLAVSRGVRCDPGHIVLVSGTQQGLQLCLGAVLRPGDAAWMEDPGYPAARKALEAVGARLVPVPVDGHRGAARHQFLCDLEADSLIGARHQGDTLVLHDALL